MEKTKNIYLVHRWDGNANSDWYNHLNNILGNNYKIIKDDMPETSKPNIEKWTSKLDNLVGILDENSYFIGHSIGCQTILRYLSQKKNIKIGGIILVAPWLKLLPGALETDEDIKVASPWLEDNIDFDSIKEITSNICCIFSDNDYFVDINEADVFKDRLNADIVILNNQGHFTEEDNIDYGKLLEILKSKLERGKS